MKYVGLVFCFISSLITLSLYLEAGYTTRMYLTYISFSLFLLSIILFVKILPNGGFILILSGLLVCVTLTFFM